MVLRTSGRDLIWIDWGDVYVVFQPDSAETHVFNEVTALILRVLEEGPLSTEAVKSEIEAALGLAAGQLALEDVAFAAARLEELGLIERLDSASTVQ